MLNISLKHLELIQFKNHSATKVDLQGKLVAIIGDNGMGKTNILDAIYVLAMCKSHISYRQGDIIQDEQTFVRLVGDFQRGQDDVQIILKYPRRGAKSFSKNGKAYSKLKEHIGYIPIVMITPDDVKLLMGGSLDRRAFVDNTICQIDPEYLNALNTYNHILKQKSSLLKSENVDFDILDIYDQSLVVQSQIIYNRRTQFFQGFTAIASKYYEDISEDKEQIEVCYRSQLIDDNLEALLSKNRSKEIIVQRCLYGIHKDDMDLLMNDKPVKSYASQGQRKSLLLALKIAQFDFMKDQLQISPLILLDDLFDKLDQHRVRQLILLLTKGDFGQIFITDTSKARVQAVIDSIPISTDWILVKEGQVISITHQ